MVITIDSEMEIWKYVVGDGMFHLKYVVIVVHVRIRPCTSIVRLSISQVSVWTTSLNYKMCRYSHFTTPQLSSIDVKSEYCLTCLCVSSLGLRFTMRLLILSRWVQHKVQPCLWASFLTIEIGLYFLRYTKTFWSMLISPTSHRLQIRFMM